MTAAVPEDGNELEEAVAELNMQPKWTQHMKKKAAKPGKPPGKVCRSHEKYGDQTWKCADPRPGSRHCSFCEPPVPG